MICIQTHFTLNRVLMLAVGLWPYQQSKLVQLQLILSSGILMSSIVFQFTVFMTAKCTLELFIKVLSCTLYFTIFIILHNSFWINIQNVRCLFEQLQHICNELKDENEIDIIKKYGANTKHYTARIMLITICSSFTIIFLPMWPRILDMVLPINESRPQYAMQFVTEYFVDREKYSYLIMLHMNAAICIGSITISGIGTTLIGYLKHVCGMFRIASYRIEQAMMINILRNTSLENKIVMHKKIIYAVDIHRKAMEFSESLTSSFKRTLFLLITVAVVCTSLSLYGYLLIIVLMDRPMKAQRTENSTGNVASHTNNVPELWLHLIGVFSLFIGIFLTNYVAQDIADHNNHVFATVYNIQWYMAPLQIQKMILFLLQRGTKSFNLNVGGLFVGSLESAATLTSASISYFTVLYSTHQ